MTAFHAKVLSGGLLELGKIVNPVPFVHWNKVDLLLTDGVNAEVTCMQFDSS